MGTIHVGSEVVDENCTGCYRCQRVCDAGVQATYRGCWFEPGHWDDAEALLTTTQLAHDVLAEKNLVLGVRAIATGKAKLMGNKTKLMKLRAVRPTAAQEAFEQKVREVTQS